MKSVSQKIRERYVQHRFDLKMCLQRREAITQSENEIADKSYRVTETDVRHFFWVFHHAHGFLDDAGLAQDRAEYEELYDRSLKAAGNDLEPF
jgi:hypothetical protein